MDAACSVAYRQWMNWQRYAIFAFVPLLVNGVLSVNAAVPQPHLYVNTNLSENDDGSTIDIFVGANINVLLKVRPEEMYRQPCLWSKISINDGDVLQEVQKPVLLPTGVTQASFRTIHVGIAQLRSNRYDCLKKLMIEWRVNIRVNSA
jgi:hypothetical protein